MKTVVCSRGHRFQKSSNCPVCPKCWSGYYKTKLGSGLSSGLSAPALRALLNEGITRLEQLVHHSEADILDLHGMGPKAMAVLKHELKQRKLSFKKAK